VLVGKALYFCVVSFTNSKWRLLILQSTWRLCKTNHDNPMMQQTRWYWNLERTFYTSQTGIFLSLTQIQRWIWEEQLSKIKLQRLCHGNPSMLISCTHLFHEQHLSTHKN
jgi:hypothetical protein